MPSLAQVARHVPQKEPRPAVERAHAAVAARKDPRPFRDAFSAVLLHQAGIALSSKPYVKERMEEDLKLALRTDGFAGDVADFKDGSRGGDFSGELSWGDEDAKELADLVRKLGCHDPNLSSEAFIKPFFRLLQLQDLNIRELDPDVGKFTRLTFLDVSRNPLKAIGALPPNLQRFKAYNTKISRVTCPPTPSLVFLGLGYTPMDDEGLAQVANRFRGLLSLDLSYSEVSSLSKATSAIKTYLPRLCQLSLGGCPACLLPHYRLKVIQQLSSNTSTPQLQYLDTSPILEEERADAQLLPAVVPWQEESFRGAAPGSHLSRPPVVKLAVQLMQLRQARSLLQVPTQGIIVKKKAEKDKRAADAAAAAGEEAPEPWEPADAVLEACVRGVMRFQFELPDRTWVETAELQLTQEMAQEAEESQPFDVLDLTKLKTADGEHFFFEVDVSSDVHSDEPRVGTAAEDRLLRLTRWLRRGMAVKVSFREAPPPTPEELAAMEEAAAAELAASKSKGGKAKAAPKAAAPTPPPAPIPDEERPPPPEEVGIGGAVVPLDGFLFRKDAGVTDADREAGELRPLPSPLQETCEVYVVPMARWLEPNVQVPLAEQTLKKDWGAPGRPEGASLGVRVILYASDPPEEEEEEPPPPVADPKAKAKK